MPTLRALQPKKLNAFRIDIDDSQFRKQILQHGMRIQWQMASECPCVRSLSLTGGSTTITQNTFEKRPDCAACSGNGWLYHSSQEIRALTLGSETQPDGFQVFGYRGTGTIRLTMLPEHLPGFMDRLTFLDSVMVYTDIVTRTSATTEQPRYPIVKRTLQLGSSGDATVADPTVIGVLNCRKTDTTGVIQTTELVENTDFAVNSDGEIDWTLGLQASTASGTSLLFDNATKTITRTGGNWITDGWKVGSHAVVTGAVLSANNGTYHITAVAALQIQVDIAPTSSLDTTAAFAGGMAPAVGSRYSVHYYASPVYIAKTFPFSFRDTRSIKKSSTESVRNMPVRVDCMLELLG